MWANKSECFPVSNDNARVFDGEEVCHSTNCAAEGIGICAVDASLEHWKKEIGITLVPGRVGPAGGCWCPELYQSGISNGNPGYPGRRSEKIWPDAG